MLLAKSINKNSRAIKFSSASSIMVVGKLKLLKTKSKKFTNK